MLNFSVVQINHQPLKMNVKRNLTLHQETSGPKNSRRARGQISRQRRYKVGLTAPEDGKSKRYKTNVIAILVYIMFWQTIYQFGRKSIIWSKNQNIVCAIISNLMMIYLECVKYIEVSVRVHFLIQIYIKKEKENREFLWLYKLKLMQPKNS